MLIYVALVLYACHLSRPYIVRSHLLLTNTLDSFFLEGFPEWMCGDKCVKFDSFEDKAREIDKLTRAMNLVYSGIITYLFQQNLLQKLVSTGYLRTG